jgi:hypothetical protein
LALQPAPVPDLCLARGAAVPEDGARWRQIAHQERRFDQADLDELRRLAGRDAQSFVAAVSELADLRLEPPRRQRFAPFIYLLVPPNEHEAEFCISHAARGNYRLALFYPNGETAYRELTEGLGNRIAVKGRRLWLVKKP